MSAIAEMAGWAINRATLKRTIRSCFNFKSMVNLIGLNAA
jgi:hypothetical protein